jgi:two-component system, NtrC family, sensor histidine kinase HydH
MPVPMLVTFVSTLAFGIQFLIFLYLYSSHRVRFFHYLLWTWGFFTLSKGLKLAEAILPAGVHLDGLMDGASVAGQFCLIGAALAYRWDYRMGWQAVGVTALGSLGLAAFGGLSASPLDLPVAFVLGGAQIAAGLAFWPRPSRGMGYRGSGLLATSLVGWGLHRIATRFLVAEPGTALHFAVVATFVGFYFLTSFAVIIMVLDRARSEMRALTELNERLVDGLREGLELVDGGYTIRHANRWMIENFGPVVGRRCYEVLTADQRRCPGCPMERREAMAGPVRLEVHGAGGRRFLLSCSPVRQPDGEVRLLELVADVTEQEQMRRRLQEAERRAATGELAAAVAHEIRNPLAAIVNATTLLDGTDPLTPEERAYTLGAVRTEARRLNRILSDFLLFARPREPRRFRADIGEVVERVAALIRDDPARANRVELDVRVDESVAPFAFDSDQITQVLWNVALNGVEAINGRGRLSLEVVRHNGEIVITVADTGCGIPSEERARVFEPFYSRKPGGSGLGLTIAQRIVAAHGGRIDLDSAPGRGTRFIIALPAVVA